MQTSLVHITTRAYFTLVRTMHTRIHTHWPRECLVFLFIV